MSLVERGGLPSLYHVSGVSPSSLRPSFELNGHKSESTEIPKTMYFGIGRVGHIAIGRRLLRPNNVSLKPESFSDIAQWEQIKLVNSVYSAKITEAFTTATEYCDLEQFAVSTFGHDLVIPQGKDWDRVITNDKKLWLSYLFSLNYIADEVLTHINLPKHGIVIPELNMVDTQSQRLTASTINRTYNQILETEGKVAADKYRMVIENYYQYGLSDDELPSEEDLKKYLAVIDSKEKNEFLENFRKALNTRSFRRDSDNKDSKRRQITGVIDGVIFSYDNSSSDAASVRQTLKDFEASKISLKNLAGWYSQGKIGILSDLAKAIFSKKADLSFNILEFKFELDAVKNKSTTQRLAKYQEQTAHEMMAFLETLSLFVKGIDVKKWLISQDERIGAQLVIVNYPCILREESDPRWGILLDPPNIEKDTLFIENKKGASVAIHTLGGFDISRLMSGINQKVNSLLL